jgi:hypothetical protein
MRAHRGFGSRGFRLRIVLALLAPALCWQAARGGQTEGAPGAAAESGSGGGNLKALGLSLLLPGLAQIESGRKLRGAAFIVADVGFWSACFISRAQGAARKDTYVQMAELYGHVPDAKGRSDDYYRMVGSWDSSDQYNETIRREARSYYPDDLEGRAAYFESHQVPADQTWSWDSQAARIRYRQKRNDSNAAYSRGRVMIALAVANRAAAMIDATLLGRHRDGMHSLTLEMVPGGDFASAQLRLRCALP